MASENGAPRVAFANAQPSADGEQSTLSPGDAVSPHSTRGSQRLVTMDDGITASRSRQASGAEEAEEKDENLEHSMFSFHKRRRQTNLSNAPKDTHYVAHKFYIRRPRALQYFYQGELIEAGDASRVDDLSEAPSRKASRSVSQNSTAPEEEESEARSTETVNKQRERLELFIDLLFVGIISNISEHFFDQAFTPGARIGRATYEFLLLFLPTFRFWNVLQQFLSSYFLDDSIQRVLLVWILILALVWGNNAPSLLKEDDSERLEESKSGTTHGSVIVVYLVAICTLLIAEAIYSIWIPWLRRYSMIAGVITLGTIGLWIAATLTSAQVQPWLIFAAIITDYVKWAALESPMGDALLGSGYKKAADWKHIRGRMENFFIIVLGEGVFLLIRGSPAGQGFTPELGAAVLGLTIYYPIHWLYFAGDQTRSFVHAKNRRWYYRTLWQFLHLVLYSNVVLLSSAVLYLVGYTHESVPTTVNTGEVVRRSGIPPPYPETSEGVPLSETHRTLQIAAQSLFGNLALILASQLCLALLNRPLESSGTLVISNRYLRMAPRAAAIVVCAALCAKKWEAVHFPLGVATLILWVILNFEWGAGMEKEGGLIEGVRWTYWSEDLKRRQSEN
ncbi:MAG: hypothetical protein M1828_005000 [Chrysothrix sp. TS-e1954]|nr:MAG: hypothetical protein M1828_005000 [Chrysothrix sp. TS-e1954]